MAVSANPPFRALLETGCCRRGLYEESINVGTRKPGRGRVWGTALWKHSSTAGAATRTRVRHGWADTVSLFCERWEIGLGQNASYRTPGFLAWYIEIEFLAAPVSRCAHPHAIIIVLGPQGGPPLIFVSEFSLSSWMEAGGNLAPLSKVHRQGLPGIRDWFTAGVSNRVHESMLVRMGRGCCYLCREPGHRG